VVPDSKAARTKIARDRNASGNSASAKNKAVAASRVAGSRVVAISKADDKAGFIGSFNGGSNSRRFVFRLPIYLQLQTNLQPPRS
jgi:hypothetical protein